MGCRGRRRSRFLMGHGSGSSDASRGGGAGGAGQRLRSGAFAPDFPFVIFVTAFGGSFRFPRAYRRPAPPAPPPRLALLVETSRTLGRTVCLGFSPPLGYGDGSCGARPRPAAQAASGGLRGVLRFPMALRAGEEWSWISRAVFRGAHQSPLPGQSPLELQCRMDGARTGLHAQTAARRAPPITTPPPLTATPEEIQSAHARQRSQSHLKR